MEQNFGRKWTDNYKNDYAQVLYNLQNRAEKELDGGTSDNVDLEDIAKTYEEEKEEMSRLFEDDDSEKMWNCKLWDICFASSYDFPHNKMGFRGQWYLEKMRPFVNYLTELANIENIHICYKKISDTDCLTLEKLFKEIKPYDCKCDYAQQNCKRCCRLKYSVNNCNFMDIITRENYNSFTFGQFECKIYDLEDIDDFRKNKLPLIHETEQAEIIDVLNRLEKHFSGGHSFFTMYLPENITGFEEIITLNDGGNFTEFIARSTEYFYFFQKTE